MSDASKFRQASTRGTASGRNKGNVRFFKDTNSAELSTGANWAPVHEFDIIFTAATATEGADTAVYIANRPVKVVAVREVHAAQSASATVILRKVISGAAVTAGTAITGSWDLNTAVSTPVAGAITTDAAATLETGDRLALDFTGTIAATVGLNVTVSLRYI